MRPPSFLGRTYFFEWRGFMRALNPDQLRTLTEVVEQGSFTLAARHLNLSQPAVSLQIRELEARCGMQLIDRVGKKPVPTPAGRQLLLHAKRILSENEDALQAMRRIRETSGQLIRVGMSLPTLTYLTRDAIRRFKHENPKIELALTLSPSTPLVDEVRNHTLDIAIVSLPLDDAQLTVRPFFEDSVAALVPEGHFSDNPKTATPALLATAPFVVQAIGDLQARLVQEWFRASGHAPLRFIEANSLEGCRAAVAAGLGVSIVPGLMALHQMGGVAVLPLEPPVRRKVAVIEPKNAIPNMAVDRLRAALLGCTQVLPG
jgi:DNA-binding transcriptional LysR family regulator